MLEVGAGIGTYTQRVLDAGAASVLALEPEPAVATALEERFGGDARVEVACEELLDAPSLQASDGQFDLVLCQNVLEHVADDREALEEIARVLAPGGWLALVVPAHPALYGSLDRAYGHHRRYRREELVRLVGESGLELRAAYPFNLLGVPGWWLSSRRRATGLGSGPLRIFDALVPLWRPLERLLRPPWGLSLVVLAQRLELTLDLSLSPSPQGGQST